MNNNLAAKPIAAPMPMGSYKPEDVIFLLKDLSAVSLEQPTEDREEAMQSGGHYSESLPIEYQPTPEYIQLFHDTLHDSAERIALAVGTVSELIIKKKGTDLVLVSLARAGTPIGVLIKRYLKQVHRLELPHYSISIIRGKGIDENALLYMKQNHPGSTIQFIDGWTGKGAIRNVLIAACDDMERKYGMKLDNDLAVLADPGSCSDTYGTREDFLIPSACLNSTVSGLMSRTVLRADLIGEGDFHGAKFYKQWMDSDLSNLYVDSIATYFERIHTNAKQEADRILTLSEASPATWQGMKDIERIQKDFGITDVNLVKPGVGETTRVLLRRVPWKILVDRIDNPNLKHILLLAKDRNVPVEQYPELTYSCCGIIKPLKGGDGMIFASDLDQTLIYSEKSKGDVSFDDMIPVELYEGRHISFMTKLAVQKLEQLSRMAQFVPVTTRTPEQFNRIFTIKEQFRPEYVIVSNGGTVIVNGLVDPEWNGIVREAVKANCAESTEILELFNKIASEHWVKSTRLCDDLFYSIVIERERLPVESIAELKLQIAALGWNYSLQGRKIYLVPEKVSKGAAIQYVKEKLNSSFVYAAGDSMLDESLLLAADYAIAPAHGELGRFYSSHPHIHFTASKGALASEELLASIIEHAGVQVQV